MPQEQREPDWKTVAQASMQQRDEANRNLCNLQIEMAVMAERLRKFEEETGTRDDGVDVQANNGVVKQAPVVKPSHKASH